MENRTVLEYSKKLNNEKINKEYREANKIGEKLVRGEFVDLEEFSYEADTLSTSIEALESARASEETIAVNKIYQEANSYLWMLATLYIQEDEFEVPQFSKVWKEACSVIKKAKKSAMKGEAISAYSFLKACYDKSERKYYPGYYYC